MSPICDTQLGSTEEKAGAPVLPEGKGGLCRMLRFIVKIVLHFIQCVWVSVCVTV